MKELISVIVPIYNVEKYINRCIDSVLAQSYKNLEIILVDDGSPDNCPEICDEYAKKDDRIKVIHKENGGLSEARNFGIEASRGEYITFVDSDDYIAPEMIETLYERIIQDKSGMAVCNFLYVDEEMNEIVERNQNMPIKNQKITSTEALLNLAKPQYQYYVIACSKLYHKSLFNDISFPIGKLHEDEFIAHKIFGKCKFISCVEKPMYYYVQHGQSIMNSEYSAKKLDAVEAFLQRSEYAMKIELNELSMNSLSNAIAYLNIGYVHKNADNGEIRKRLKKLKKEYNITYLKIIKKKNPVKIKLIMTIFFVSPMLYRAYVGLVRQIKNL